MKNLKALLLLLILQALPAIADDSVFGGKDGCFLLVQIKNNQVIEKINPDRCGQRFSPCSTFKVPAAVMAFDSKIVDPNYKFKWTGLRDERPECNQDQTLSEWMTRSVVWVTQEITKKLGLATVKNYLKHFKYGNQDFSGGLTQAWLTSSLKISALEQASFMNQLIQHNLPVSDYAQGETIKILVREQLDSKGNPVQQVGASDFMMEGKTGSGRLGEGRQLGWYVGHLRAKKQDYIVVMNTSDKIGDKTAGYGGPMTKQLVKAHLFRKGLWPSSER